MDRSRYERWTTRGPFVLHPSRCSLSYIGTIQSRYYMKTHIDACRDACRSNNMSLVDDAFICHHFYLGIRAAQPLDTIPVRCCTMVIKKAAFSQEKSSSA